MPKSSKALDAKQRARTSLVSGLRHIVTTLKSLAEAPNEASHHPQMAPTISETSHVSDTSVRDHVRVEINWNDVLDDLNS